MKSVEIVYIYKCVRKSTDSRLRLTHYANKSRRSAA